MHVVAPEEQPLAKVLGREVGEFIRTLHESHGVVFHLQRTVASVNSTGAVLSDGTSIAADFIVVGAGVRPSLTLAELAGLNLDHGVLVDQYLETSCQGIFAAGDIACWPDPHTGRSIRVEHWVVAERQGQVAARNMLGQKVPFDAVPFFWSQHYDVTINYTGHAERWDSIHIDGSLAERSCAIEYQLGGKVLAVATIGRDLACLEAERKMEQSNG